MTGTKGVLGPQGVLRAGDPRCQAGKPNLRVFGASRFGADRPLFGLETPFIVRGMSRNGFGTSRFDRSRSRFVFERARNVLEPMFFVFSQRLLGGEHMFFDF